MRIIFLNAGIFDACPWPKLQSEMMDLDLASTATALVTRNFAWYSTNMKLVVTIACARLHRSIFSCAKAGLGGHHMQLEPTDFRPEADSLLLNALRRDS